MQNLSPKARFDALADVLQFDSSSVDSIRHSINHLLKDVNDLVRMVNESMTRESANDVVGELDAGAREKMQSLLASFIMRTINCNFDEDYCNYVYEISHADDVPPNVFLLGLTLCNEYAVWCLIANVEDKQRLTDMLSAWNRLTAILKNLTHK